MTYTLVRDRDGAGDSGGMSNTVRRKPGSSEIEYGDGVPAVGWAVQVGAIGSRTFAAQDWWCTTPVTEILTDKTEKDNDNPDSATVRTIRFKTGNSVYTWKSYT